MAVGNLSQIHLTAPGTWKQVFNFTVPFHRINLPIIKSMVKHSQPPDFWDGGEATCVVCQCEKYAQPSGMEETI